MFRSKGRVEDDFLNVDDPFGKLVHFLVPFEKDAVPVGEVKNTRKGGRLAIRYLLSGCEAEKLGSPLQVTILR